MTENISEHTTSLTGLTCKPLAILSETISPQEMSMARGGNDNGNPGGLEQGAGCDPHCIDHCCQPVEVVIVDPVPQGGRVVSSSRPNGETTVVGSPELIEAAADIVSDVAEWDPDIPGPSEIVNEVADTWNETVDYVVDFVAENFDIYLTEDAEIEAEIEAMEEEERQREIEAMEEEERQREEEERQRLDEEGEDDDGSGLDGMEGDFDLGDRDQVLV